MGDVLLLPLLLLDATSLFVVSFCVGWSAAYRDLRKRRLQKPVRLFRYVGIIHKGQDCYRLTFPDFPECATVADSLGMLHHNAEVVLRFHLENVLEEQHPLPKPTTPQVCFLLLEELPEAIGFWVIRVEL